MKAVGALVFLLLGAIVLFNAWQIRELRQDLDQLRSKLEEQKRMAASERLLSEAIQALLAAREAVGSADPAKAVALVSAARQRIAEAAASASRSAKPVLNLLDSQASELSRRFNGAVLNR